MINKNEVLHPLLAESSINRNYSWNDENEGPGFNIMSSPLSTPPDENR